MVRLVALCLLSLITASQPTYSAEQCYHDGETLSLTCEFPAEGGVVDWFGDGFDCPSPSSVEHNTLVLQTNPCPLPMVRTGVCGPYSANLTCSEDGTHLISVLNFTAEYSMNQQTIQCFHHEEIIEKFTLRIGLIPDPPAYVKLTFGLSDRSYKWIPPDGLVIGGIAGYSLVFNGSCGYCPFNGLVNNTTLIATCQSLNGTETLMGQMCKFEVRTVTSDCGFISQPAKLSVNDTFPTDVTVSKICLDSNDLVLINVEWNYLFPELSIINIPGVRGFQVIIADEFNHTQPLEFLPGSVDRSYQFSSTLLHTNGLVGDSRVAIVAVETDVGSRTFNTSATFSVKPVMVTTNSALSTNQCIEVSINHCNDSVDSFQTQLLVSEGICEDNAVFTPSDNYTLDVGYRACIFVEIKTLCYSAVAYYKGKEIGRTDPQKLVLLYCNANDLRLSTGVVMDSNSEEMPHNTVTNFSCSDSLCTLSGHNQSRCVNGSFDLPTSPVCNCENIGYIIGGTVGTLLLVCIVVLAVTVIGIVIQKLCKCSCKCPTICCQKKTWDPPKYDTTRDATRTDSGSAISAV